MATWQHELVEPPENPRHRELWLQHAAGFILMEDVRQYAVKRIDPDLPPEVRAAVLRGIDDAVYGVMMVIEGVTGFLSNSRHAVCLDIIARFESRDQAGEGEALWQLNLREGDGMCMGYHGWIAGDFGKDPVATPKART